MGAEDVERGGRFSPLHATGHPVSFLSSRQAEMHASEPINVQVRGAVTLSYQEQPQGQAMLVPWTLPRSKVPLVRSLGQKEEDF